MAELISLDEARGLVRRAVDTMVDLESLALLESRGRRLAQDYQADTPWPATDRSAMDGYAVRAGASGLPAGTRLEVVGAGLAGHPFAGEVADGEAIRIMTGAVVPATVDAVVAVENTSGYVDEGQTVELTQEVSRAANIRPVGSEVEVGDLLLGAGTRIGAAEIGALAVLGIDPVPVFRRPVVAVLATGDEVVDIARVPASHQVRNSNAYALAAQVQACGGEPFLLGIAKDDDHDLRAKLTDGLDRADVLLTIGGVSKGSHDLVHDILGELGIERVFHGVKLKPGKPAYFGSRLDTAGAKVTELRRKTFVFGLPGNPASTFTVFDLLVRPLIALLSGAPDEELAAEPLRARVAGVPFKKNWREQAVPTSLRCESDGTLIAELGPSKPSGDPFGLTKGKAYALIPPDTEATADLVLPVVFYADYESYGA
jgi:molybdopterin molybdotransferase